MADSRVSVDVFLRLDGTEVWLDYEIKTPDRGTVRVRTESIAEMSGSEKRQLHDEFYRR